MPRAIAQMPNSVTLDNATTDKVSLGGLAALEPSETGKVIDLTKFDDFNGEDSWRARLWNAIAGAVASGLVTIAGSSPSLSPAFNYDDLDGPGYGDQAADGLALRPGLPGYVADTVRPEISGAVVGSGSAYVDVTFTEGVYSAANPAGPVDAADFVLSNFNAGGGTLTDLELDGTATKADGNPLVGGETVIRLGLTPTGTPDANGTFDLAAAAGAIIDNKGNGAVEVAETGIATVA